VLYQLVHAVALLALPETTSPLTVKLWTAGVPLFSGSIYGEDVHPHPTHPNTNSSLPHDTLRCPFASPHRLSCALPRKVPMRSTLRPAGGGVGLYVEEFAVDGVGRAREALRAPSFVRHNHSIPRAHSLALIWVVESGLALGGPKLLGPVTPIGGLCFIGGWLTLLL
jgi:hypothetical protein